MTPIDPDVFQDPNGQAERLARNLSRDDAATIRRWVPDALRTAQSAYDDYESIIGSLKEQAYSEMYDAMPDYVNLSSTLEGRAENYRESAQADADKIMLKGMNASAQLYSEASPVISYLGLNPYPEMIVGRAAATMTPADAYELLSSEQAQRELVAKAVSPSDQPCITEDGEVRYDGCPPVGDTPGTSPVDGPVSPPPPGSGSPPTVPEPGPLPGDVDEPGESETTPEECKPQCPPDGPTPIEPVDDPACISPALALSQAVARGWAVSPLDGGTGSKAPFSRHIVVSSQAGFTRRLLVTGQYGKVGAGRVKPGSAWASHGLYGMPDGLSQTFVQFDPSPDEPEPVCEPPNEDEELPDDETEEDEPVPEDEEEEDEEEEEETDGGTGEEPGSSPPPPPAQPPRTGPTEPVAGVFKPIEFSTVCEFLAHQNIQPVYGGACQPITGTTADPAYGGTFGELLTDLGLSVTSGLSSLPAWISYALGVGSPPWKSIVDFVTKSIAMAGPEVNKILCNAGINNGANMAIVGTAQAGLAWIERLTGFPCSYYSTPLTYVRNNSNPVNILNQAAADECFNRGMIDEQEWVCNTRALGNIPFHYVNQRRLGENRLTPDETILAYKRGLIGEIGFRQEMRRNGVVDPGQDEIRLKLFERVPDFSDIIRFMVRDVANPQAVEAGQLDQGFQQNFQGKLREWAESQGVTVEVALANWRAHWNYPSNTAVYEMVRRLRPGNVDPSIQFTKEDAKKVLQINDVAPGMIDKLLAVSFNPLTRTDIRMGFQNDAFPIDVAVQKLQDTGLNLDDSIFVADLWEREKSLRDRNIGSKISGWTRTAATNAYLDGTIDVMEYENILIQLGITPGDIREIMQWADLKGTIRRRSKCTAGIRKQYMIGELTDADAAGLLNSIGHLGVNADRLVSYWQCERLSKRKELPAAKNQELVLRGIITEGEYRNRLFNLGYGQREIELLSLETLSRLNEKALKELNKSLAGDIANKRKNLAEFNRRIKDAEKRLKELQKNLGGSEGGS